MNLAGLGLRAAVERLAVRKKRCDRCGESCNYNVLDCPQCTEVSASEIRHLLKEESEKHRHRVHAIGIFLLFSAFVLAIIVAIALAL